MSKGKGYLFDGPKTPLVYSSSGINMDYVRHKDSEMDADITSDEMEAAYFDGGPVTCLEQSLTVTGAAQTMTYTAPRVSDASIGRLPRLIGVEMAIQLNPLSVPKTDFNFTISYVNCFGTALTAMEQAVTGNASITDGNTRQYIRFIPFVRYSSVTAAGVVNLEDGKDPVFPLFGTLSAGDISGTGISAANLQAALSPQREVIGSVVVTIPASSMTAGAIVTLTPVTSGRKDSVAQMILALDSVGAANSKPADAADTSYKMTS